MYELKYLFILFVHYGSQSLAILFVSFIFFISFLRREDNRWPFYPFFLSFIFFLILCFETRILGSHFLYSFLILFSFFSLSLLSDWNTRWTSATAGTW